MRDLSQYEAEYQANYGFERHMVRFRRRQVLECLAQYRHERVLEVGCGVEPLFEHFDDWQQYTVVEPGMAFADLARSRLPAGRDIILHQAFLEDAQELLLGRAFDFVVVSSVIHEVADPLRLLVAVHALCTPDTVVHVNVPNVRSLHNLVGLKMGLIADLFEHSSLARRMQRTTTFDLAGLLRLMNDAGFRVETSGSYFLKPFTHAQMEQMLHHAIIDEKALVGLYEVNAEFDGIGAEIYANAKTA
jgi:2-polyprenyl-3-methyl-5-hydroxy-6-metoxy-1,4-benzoquinol methylase